MLNKNTENAAGNADMDETRMQNSARANRRSQVFALIGHAMREAYFRAKSRGLLVLTLSVLNTGAQLAAIGIVVAVAQLLATENGVIEIFGFTFEPTLSVALLVQAIAAVALSLLAAAGFAICRRTPDRSVSNLLFPLTYSKASRQAKRRSRSWIIDQLSAKAIRTDDAPRMPLSVTGLRRRTERHSTYSHVFWACCYFLRRTFQASRFCLCCSSVWQRRRTLRLRFGAPVFQATY